MIKLLRQIYRRWLIQYRWANIFSGWFNRVYDRYLSIVRYLALRFTTGYSLLNSVTQLEAATLCMGSSKSEIWFLDNVATVGHSRFILKSNQAAYDSSHPDFLTRDIYLSYCFQEECFNKFIYLTQSGRCYFPGLKIQARLDGKWLSVMSGSTANWMHWISENIPRLAVMLAELKNNSFGILVDQGLVKNMREVLDIIAPDIPRFEVRPFHAVEISQLIVSSTPSGMCAVWRRPSSFSNEAESSIKMPFPKNGIHHFDSNGLRLSRNIILRNFDVLPEKSSMLFIQRKSAWRHMTNEKRIMTLLLERGFSIASPGEMSVEEQVKLFSTASVVVAQAGAVLANIMFMPEGSTVICIAVQNEHTNFDYFRDYAKIFGVSLVYVLGRIDDPNKYNDKHTGDASHPMNAELSCPEDELLELVGRSKQQLDGTYV